jgi:Zn-dependent protease with chaperone function
MSDRPVTIETFHTFGHACDVVGRLTTAGIPAEINDEHDLMGFGWFHVRVREADLERAAAVLAGDDESDDEAEQQDPDPPPEKGFAARLEAVAEQTNADRDVEAYYPPSPRDIPADLTHPSARYAARVRLLLVGLILFALLYGALIVGTVAFTWWAVVHDFGEDPWVGSPAMNILLGLGGGMLSLFFVKGLFKVRRDDFRRYFEVTQADQPRLFAFIRRVCREAGAPAPARVYVGTEANAMVAYDTSLLALVVPPEKHLVIGLGLVNAVTLTEFKAIMAHEFGHFSQRALGLGPYTATATRVLWDVVYARDRWDDWLGRWCRTDPRLSFPAWGVWGTVWVLRHLLGGVFRAVLSVDMSLRRELEFNADDVAVSLAGSDAVPHCLHRSGQAIEDLSAAGRALQTAAEQGLISRDLFHHQTAARTRRERLSNTTAAPPVGPRACVFSTNSPAEFLSPPDWQRTHPTNPEREANAKRHYIPVPLDDRPAWLLFRNADALRAEVTGRFYLNELNHPGTPATAAPAVQAFIDAELDETTFDRRYGGLYDDRPMWPGDPNLPIDLPTFFAAWPDPTAEAKAAEYRQLQIELEMLTAVDRNALGPIPNVIRFRDADRSRRDVPELLEIVGRESNAVRGTLGGLDTRVFAAHTRAAHSLDGDSGPLTIELRDRYQFHSQIQKLIDQLRGDEARLWAMFGFLGWRAGADMRLFNHIVKTFKDVEASLASCLTTAAGLQLPPLANVPAGTPLGDLLRVPGPELPRLPDHMYSVGPHWTNEYLRVRAGVESRLVRVRTKNWGRILKLQQRIEVQWRRLNPVLPPPECDDS